MSFIRRNLEEIFESRWLRYLGAALALTHVLTFLFWIEEGQFFVIMAGNPPICWPFIERCDNPVIRGWFGSGFLVFYFSLAVLNIALFFRNTTTSRKLAWGSLAALTVLKGLAVAQDYRLMGNYNYMQFLVSIAFLVLPFKEKLIPRLIVFFYFWAGTLKLNQEWLSGSILTEVHLPATVLRIACAYAAFLELFLSWGLLSPKPRVFYPVIAQFVAFHAFSYPEVGFFYPLLMISLDSCFLLRHVLSKERQHSENSLLDEWRDTPRFAATALAIFSGAQVIPHLYRGDTALTSEGRIFALSMLDANTRCETRMIAHFANKALPVGSIIPALQPRIQCDPAVFYSYSKSLCRTGKQFANDYSISLDLRSKRSTDELFHSIVHEKDMCRESLELHIWKPNPWVHDELIGKDASGTR